ncbi:MAG: PEP-utilizing enzyme [Actinobacteria bacterium]|nr:PEP-utilizing enzyme [Actinomycetota bacterium]
MLSLVGRYAGRNEGGTVDVRAAFAAYKRVMDDNSRALEIITDMGETMSGGYLFDIVYLRKAYSDLAASVRVSLKDFNQLTARSYPALTRAFEEIDEHIESLVAGDARPLERLTVRFEEITPAMAREVGGKNFHLAEIRNRLGLPAPDGFALTIFAFEEFIRHNQLGEAIASLESDGDEPGRRRRLRERILAGSIPPSLESDLNVALDWLRSRCGGCNVAVRSSAEEEDGFFSFAGQFETVLGVPAETAAVGDAYRRVAASLFSDEAMAYQRRLGYRPGSLRMAVGCVAMVDAAASGVAYTADPLGGDDSVMVINSSWGLGPSVVEGTADADRFVVEKTAPFEVAQRTLGRKETMTALAAEAGVREIDTAGDRRHAFSLAPRDLEDIVHKALAIEEFYRRPQDIEWALDANGRVVILQARPLRIERAAPAVGLREAAEERGPHEAGPGQASTAGHNVLLHNKGNVVQPGAVGGRVFFASSPEALEEFPRDAILVARHDSPRYARVMPYAAAIITDAGNTTSHMASISREFRVPTVVNTRVATTVLKPGAEITLQAGEDGSMTVYEGIAREIIDEQHDTFLKLEELYEFRRRKFVMKYITPLNLVNPFTDDFAPENCRTIHDILRFIHEKSMRELIEASRHAERGPALKRLDIPFMDNIHVIDIGAGLAAGAGDVIGVDEVASVPLRAILDGMSFPGAWRKGGVPISISDFFTASMRTGSLLEDVDINLAVISHFYMNLAVRFGYHYTVVDCFASQRAASNHIYFRFLGGAADLSKRLRRIEMLEIILDHLGFASRAKGDLITATITNISQEETVRLLDQAGRLMAFTRQLDAMLTSDGAVKEYAQKFIEGDYELFG